MKLFTNCLLICCFVFFEVIAFLEYSETTYFNIFNGKECIYIEKNENQSSVEFISTLREMSDLTGCDLFYISVDGESSAKPLFNIYTTSTAPDFFPITIKSNDINIRGEYISSDFEDGHASGYIVGANLQYDFRIYDFEIIENLDLNHSKFYARAETRDVFARLMKQNGYQVAYGTSDAFDVSDSMFELKLMFGILTMFLFFSTVCYAFSKNKEIVIKKINGFDEFRVFTSTFSDIAKKIIVWGLLALLLSTATVGFKYPISCADFWAYQIVRLIYYVVICEIIYIMACLFVQFRKSADEIRGYRPDRLLYITAILVRVFVATVVIWGLSYALESVLYTRNLLKYESNISYMSRDYVTLSLNSGSTDLHGNTPEYMEKSRTLVNSLVQNFDAIIVDSIDYFEGTRNGTPILYVNKNYFTLNPIDLTGETSIEDLEFSPEDDNIFLPSGFRADLPEIHGADTKTINTYYYEQGQSFCTFNIFSAVNRGGEIANPIIAIINEDTLQWKAESIIGEHFLLIPIKSQQTLSEIKEIVRGCGMGDVVLEAPTIKELFDVQIMRSRIKEVEYILVATLYVIVQIMIISFETLVYYENNKKQIAIKKLHGFGIYTYRVPLMIKAIASGVLIAITLSQKFHVIFALFAVLIDIIVFTHCIHTLESGEVVLYLKGEI